jgi:hypothetical protein
MHIPNLSTLFAINLRSSSRDQTGEIAEKQASLSRRITCVMGQEYCFCSEKPVFIIEASYKVFI